MSWPVLVVDVTGSTNADLTEAARGGDRGPRLLAARAQTAGRGRLGRAWRSEVEASLSLSLLWSPEVPQPGWTWLPMVAGLAVVDAATALGVGARLKWPNDVVVPLGPPAAPPGGAPAGALTGLAKLAGVLVEGVAGPAGPVAVVGVGVNLLDPPGVDRPAASLSGCSGARVRFDDVVPVVARALERRLRAWEGAGGDPEASGVRRDYLAACSTTGRQVRVLTPGGHRHGLAVDVDRVGALVLQGADGRVTVSAGDVEHVR